MILWTILPLEMVFAEANSQPPTFDEIEYAGRTVMVEKIGADNMKVVRVITTDPQDYLRPEFQPGTVLKYKPTLEALS